MNGLCLRILQRGVVEAHQQPLAFGGGHNRQPRQRQVRFLFQSLDQTVQGAEHITTDPFGTDFRQGTDAQGEVFAQVIHRQGQRIVGAFLAGKGLDATPGRLLSAAARQVAVVEQGAEQRSRRDHAAAALGQGQRRMLMSQQRGEPRMGRLDPGPRTLLAHGYP